jgi:predicted nucleic acid-binding protein
MRVFVDTSALYALLADDDPQHERAVATWRSLLQGSDLVTHNYVHLEAAQLVRKRLGGSAVDVLLGVVLPSIQTAWVDEALHAGALDAWSASGWRTSLVDQLSFAYMRRNGIDVAFAYDRDFESAGFRLAAAPRTAGGQRLAEDRSPYRTSMTNESDLVGIAEIAARSGHPTSTIQSWRRRHAGFPTPFAHLASGPVWQWPVVDRWIRAEPRRVVGLWKGKVTVAPDWDSPEINAKNAAVFDAS